MATVDRDIKVTMPSDLEVLITREFDAPRDLVFEAHTACEHMSKWWGPRKYDIPECDIDFREGGNWRIVHRGPDGDEHVFRGEYREIVRPERLVWTFEWMGAPGHISVQTLELEELDGKTLMKSKLTFDTKEDRDGMMASGAAEGGAESWERLDEYLETLKDRGGR